MKTLVKHFSETFLFLKSGFLFLFLGTSFFTLAQNGITTTQTVPQQVPSNLEAWEAPNGGVFELTLNNVSGMPQEAQVIITFEQNNRVLIEAASDIMLSEPGIPIQYKQFDGRKWPHYNVSPTPPSLQNGELPTGMIEISTMVISPLNNQILGEAISYCEVENKNEPPAPGNDECAGSNKEPIHNLDMEINKLGKVNFAKTAQLNHSKWKNFQGMCGYAIVNMQRNNRQLYNKFTNTEARIKQLLEQWAAQNQGGNPPNQGGKKVTNNSLLPPSYKSMHKNLGDEQFADLLRRNHKKTQNYHGIDQYMLDIMKKKKPAEYRQFRIRESKLKQWFEAWSGNPPNSNDWNPDNDFEDPIIEDNGNVNQDKSPEEILIEFFNLDPSDLEIKEALEFLKNGNPNNPDLIDDNEERIYRNMKKGLTDLKTLQKYGRKFTSRVRNSKNITEEVVHIYFIRRTITEFNNHPTRIGRLSAVYVAKSLLTQPDPFLKRSWLLSFLPPNCRKMMLPIIGKNLKHSEAAIAFLRTLTVKERKVVMTEMFKNPAMKLTHKQDLIRKFSASAPDKLPPNLEKFKKIRQAFDKLKNNGGHGNFNHAKELFDLLKIPFMKTIKFHVRGTALKPELWVNGVGKIATAEDINDLDIFSGKALGLPYNYTIDYWTKQWEFVDRHAGDLEFDRSFRRQWQNYEIAKRNLKSYLDQVRKNNQNLDKQKAQKLRDQAFQTLAVLLRKYGQKIDRRRKILDKAIIAVSTIEKTCDQAIGKLGKGFPMLRVLYKGAKEVGVGAVKGEKANIIILRASLASMFELVDPVSKTPYKEFVEKTMKSLAVAEGKAWIAYLNTNGTEKQKKAAYKRKFKSEFTGAMLKNAIAINKINSKWMNEFLDVAFDVFIQPRLDKQGK